MSSKAFGPWNLRYAAHLGIRSERSPQFKHWAGSDDPLAQIRHTAELGFTGIFDNGLKRRAHREQHRMGEALSRLGLAMGTFVNNPDLENKTPWYARDADNRVRIRREVTDSIAVAKRVHGQLINIISGVDKMLDHDRQLAAMADNLREVAPLAEESDVILAIEPVSERRVPGLLVRHLHEAQALVDAVASPAVRIVFDTHHVRAMDGEVVAQFDRHRSSIAVVQLGDYPNRQEPGTGEIDFVGFFRRLLAVGYEGLVEMEYDCSEPGERGERQAVATLRAIDTEARQ